MDEELRKYLEELEQRIKDRIAAESRDGIKEPSRSPLEGDAFDFPLEP